MDTNKFLTDSENNSILIDPDTMFQLDEMDEGMQKLAINV